LEFRDKVLGIRGSDLGFGVWGLGFDRVWSGVNLGRTGFLRGLHMLTHPLGLETGSRV
jgi:hypothetical protein